MADFQRFYMENYNKAIGYTMKKVKNAQDAEDLVMDTFTSCYQNLDRFDESRASMGTWFYVALNNRIKNYYRDVKPFDELDVNMAVESSFEEELVEAEALSSMRQELADALKKLSEEERTILIMTYFQNKKGPDIAKELSLEKGTVRQKLNRTRKKLHTILVKKKKEWEG